MALFPDIAGRTQENSKQFSVVGWYRPSLQILVSSSAAANANAGAREMLRVQSAHAKSFFVGEHRKSSSDFMGLIHYHPTQDWHSDAFESVDEDGKIVNNLLCNLIGNVPVPGCEHSFVMDDAMLKVSYSRNYLPQWKETEEKIRKLWLSWRVGKAPPGTRICKKNL